jgi:hypothetical protein
MMNKRKNKEFDAVKLMRKLRDEINKEIDSMSTEQIIEYFRKAREQYEKEMISR